MGASVTQDGVAFRVWAPEARSVDVELVESGETARLARGRDGVWSGSVATAGPGTRYWYRLNGDLKRPDPYSRLQPDGVHGPSEVVDPAAFEWHDADWRGHGIQSLVVYQLHVGTATPEGTFDSLIGE